MVEQEVFFNVRMIATYLKDNQVILHLVLAKKIQESASLVMNNHRTSLSFKGSQVICR